MSRPRVKHGELTPLFITRIDDFFYGQRKVAYEQLGLAARPEVNIQLHTFYNMMRGENCTEAQVVAVEQALIAWARQNRPNAAVRELELSATPLGS